MYDVKNNIKVGGNSQCVCINCGNDNIRYLSLAKWCEIKEEMVLDDVFGEPFCMDCESGVEL